MSDGRWEVQTAIYAALVAAGVGTSDTIKSPVPEGYAPPNQTDIYFSIEDGDATDDDCEGMTGLDERIVIHAWHRAQSYKTMKQSISLIRDALHNKQLTVTGQVDAYSLVRSDQIMKDPDGLHLHGVIEVIVLHHS